jgi:hypothetical protein
VDVLFFELVQIVSWFNPITYFIKEDIKLVHEYIADELTTSVSIQKHDYALFIIENSFGVIPNQLSNQIFNHSLIKRRIKMLNKQKSGGLAKLKFLLLVPLTGGLLFTSTMAFSKEYVLFDLLPQDNLTGENMLQDVPKPDKTKKVSPPPPPAEPRVIKFAKPKKAPKFPPPIVKPDKPRNQNVKFPPPIVRPSQPNKPGTPPPPPPVEPHVKNDIIYGDPTPGQKNEETVEGDPTENQTITTVKNMTAGKATLTNVKILGNSGTIKSASKSTLEAITIRANEGTSKNTISSPQPVLKIKLKEPTLTGVKITGKGTSSINN